MERGTIFDIREFTVHDGPGMRTTVFLKGCPLRCAWCHNPEGLSFEPELMVREDACQCCGSCRRPCSHEACRPFGRCTRACPHGLLRIAGETVTAGELAARLKKQENILRANSGGITISGGEPLAQPAFLLELLGELQPIHTVIETSGHGAPEAFAHAIVRTSLILFDIKHTDARRHRELTGQDNRLILENLAVLIASGRPFIARIPLIPGVNDSPENLRTTAQLLKDAPGLQRVELLPYNPFAGAKYPLVGRIYRPGFDEKRAVRADTAAFERFHLPCVVL
jgi:pyruvate formate lyase activating enzyme